MNRSAGAEERNPIGGQLLDNLVVFVTGGTDRVFGGDLAVQLNELADRPWNEVRNGKPPGEWAPNRPPRGGVRAPETAKGTRR